MQMQYIGEFISIGVAISWTITAILSEYAGKRMGSVVLNMYRMLFALAFSVVFFLVVLGCPLPLAASGSAYLWMMLSGVIGYVVCDYCLMKCYIIIDSSYGQLFMTLAPVSAAITAWITLGQQLSFKSILAMAVTLLGIGIASTLMAMTPIFILPASHYIFHQPVTPRSVIGAIISVVGVSLFF